MRSRVEIEQPFFLDGEEGSLYASLGQTDDYLELVFPDAEASRLRGWVSGLSADGLDLRFREGPPPMLCAMALYVDAEEERKRSPKERLASMLSRLAEFAPRLDFGGLLPRRQLVEVVELEVKPSEGKRVRAAGDGMWDLLAEAYLEKARGMARQGQLHKALRTLEQLQKQNPLDLRARDLQQEIRQLERREKRRRREPFNPQAVLEVGFSYLLLDRNSEAADALGQAARSLPGHHLTQLLLGIALHRVGQRPAARAAYERAARLRPGEEIHRELLDALERGLPPIALSESRPGHSGDGTVPWGAWARAV